MPIHKLDLPLFQTTLTELNIFPIFLTMQWINMVGQIYNYIYKTLYCVPCFIHTMLPSSVILGSYPQLYATTTGFISVQPSAVQLFDMFPAKKVKIWSFIPPVITATWQHLKYTKPEMRPPITAKQAKEMSTSWISSGQWINQQEITYICMHWKTWNASTLSYFRRCCNIKYYNLIYFK